MHRIRRVAVIVLRALQNGVDLVLVQAVDDVYGLFSRKGVVQKLLPLKEYLRATPAKITVKGRHRGEPVQHDRRCAARVHNAKMSVFLRRVRTSL